MPRLLGVDIPNDRPTVIALQYLYGVGPKIARELCHKAGVDPQARAKELREDELARMAALLDKDYVVEGQLRRQTNQNILRLARHRLLSGHPPPPRPARSRPAHAHQRPHPQRSQEDRRREEGRQGHAVIEHRFQISNQKSDGKSQTTNSGPAQTAQRRKARRSVSVGVAHIKATFNNTTITITDTKGDVLCWASAGTSGFKGSRKSTPVRRTDVGPAGRREGDQVWHEGSRREGPRTGQRPRKRHHRPTGRRAEDQVDRGRHAAAAQRLPAQETPPRVGTSEIRNQFEARNRK